MMMPLFRGKKTKWQTFIILLITSIDLSRRHFGAISVFIIIIFGEPDGEDPSHNFFFCLFLVSERRSKGPGLFAGCIILFLYGTAGTGLAGGGSAIFWYLARSYSSVRIVSFPHTLMTYRKQQQKGEEKCEQKGKKKIQITMEADRTNMTKEKKKKNRINDWN